MYSRSATLSVSLFLFLFLVFLQEDFSFSPFFDPPSFASLPLFIAAIIGLIITAVLFPSGVSGIFLPYFIDFFTFLSWNSDCPGVICTVQAVLCALNKAEIR